MSIQMVGWVLSQSIGDSIAKLCLISIANAHNQTTGQCNPSYSVIAVEADCSRRTAIRKVEWLEEQGWIRSVSRKNRGVSGSNSYIIISDESASLYGDRLSPRGDTCDTRGGDNCVTHKEPEIRTGKEKNTKKEKSAFDWLTLTVGDELSKAVIDHRKAIKKPLTPTAAKLLANEFEKSGSPTEAAEAMLLSGWQGFKASWDWKSSRPLKPVSGDLYENSEYIRRKSEIERQELAGEINVYEKMDRVRELSREFS